ncbi:MAG: hypothetical protein VB036_03525 [Propionicimonas sp.]|nr:hypothetical protein [Propionicimonas sp.]
MDTVNLTAWVVEFSTPSTAKPGCIIVFVACPHCGGRHQHGTTEDAYLADDMGDRGAHCDTQTIGADSGYTLHRAAEEFAAEFNKSRQCAAITAQGPQCQNKAAELGAPLCRRHRHNRHLYTATGPFYQDTTTTDGRPVA